MDKIINKTSKYLSFVLRHRPDSIGLALDEFGWASTHELIAKTKDIELNDVILQRVVQTNDKQRFALSEDGKKIRANQGHSIDINLALTPATPPKILLHGTAERFVSSIKQQGVVRKNRHHVHLSASEDVAISVGSRYGRPVVLKIDSESMVSAGHIFYRTANHVWLTENVPPQFIGFPTE